MKAEYGVIERILTMFGSTYSCESAFSTLNIIKTNYRSRMPLSHSVEPQALYVFEDVTSLRVKRNVGIYANSSKGRRHVTVGYSHQVEAPDFKLET